MSKAIPPKTDRSKSLRPPSPFSDQELYNPNVNKWAYGKHNRPGRKRIRWRLAPRWKAVSRKIFERRSPHALISALLGARQFETNHWRSICDVSLTLKQGRVGENGSWIRLDAHECEEAFRFFMRLLNAAVFGEKSARRFAERRLKVIPILEKKREGRWHLHAAMEPPADMSFAEFEGLIRECWSKAYWAYDKNVIRPNADRGWIEYMLKESQKSELESWSDTIIWNCLYNPIVGA